MFSSSSSSLAMQRQKPASSESEAPEIIPVHDMNTPTQSILHQDVLNELDVTDGSRAQTGINQYVDAILRGVVSGLTSIVDMVMHPVDNILYPISILAYDATIIHATHTPASPLQPDFLVLQQYLQNNPHMYHDAVSRMEGRIDLYKQQGVRFLEASGQQRAEIIAELATGILVPAYFFHGVKCASAIARNGIANRIEFGTFTQPPHFHNVRTHEVSTLAPKFETLSPAQIQSLSGTNNYIWVVTTDNQLVIAARRVESTGHRLGLILPEQFKTMDLHHHHLARLKPVLAAGELTTNGRSIQCITDLSGHYLPTGPHLPYLVERNFKRFGFADASGKYQPYVPIPGMSIVETPHITYPRPEPVTLNMTPSIGDLVVARAMTNSNFMAEIDLQNKAKDLVSALENSGSPAANNKDGTTGTNSAALTIAVTEAMISSAVREVKIPETEPTKKTPATVNFMAESRNRTQAHNLIAPSIPFNHCLANNPLFNTPFEPRINSFNVTTWASSDFGVARMLSDLAAQSATSRAESELKTRLFIQYGYVPVDIYNRITDELKWNILRQNSMTFNSYSSFSSSISHTGYTGFNSSWLSCSNFMMSLLSNNLTATYNAYILYLKQKSAHRWRWIHFGKAIGWKYFEKDIGGVATDVATIADMTDSTTHAEAEEYFLCLPQRDLPGSESTIKQIKAELANAFFNYDTLPFFSLHFNQHGILYPIIHPAFENTLVGNIIGMLDYWMKGFLNGGVFDEAFLQRWHETGNCDEALLRSMMIDLKKYCREQHINYFSIRELESRYGIEEKSIHSAYSQPFMTSFRIISFQEKIERHGNVLVPSPSFRIEYTIDMMPDYKEYVDAHIREHGGYPADHQKILNCYELFAEEIKNTMPTLPFCRDYFQLLGVINSLSYFYATLDKMGKRPVVEIPTTQAIYSFPKSLPPIPVRYYRTYPLELSFDSVLKKLIDNDEKKAQFDSAFATLFSEKSVLKCPTVLHTPMQQVIDDLIRQHMADKLSSEELQELNEEETSKISKKIQQTIAGIANIQFRTLNNALDSLLSASGVIILSTVRKQIDDSPLPRKFNLVTTRLSKHYNSLIAQLNAKPELVQNIAALRIHPDLQPVLKRAFKSIKKSLHTLSQNLIEMDAELGCQEKNATEKLHADKTMLTDKIAQYRQWIMEAQTHKASQLAKIPPNQHHNYLGQISELETSTNQAIAHYNEGITKLQNVVDALDQAIKEIPEKSHLILASQNATTMERVREFFETNEEAISGFKTMSDQFVENREEETESRLARLHKLTLETINRACKNVAITVINNYLKSVAELQTRRYHSVMHFSDTLLDIPPLCRTLVAERYTHGFIGFTGKTLDEQTGERFKIAGGCSLALPALQSTPLEHGEQFIASMAQYRQEEESDFATFTHNDMQWVAYKIPVRDHLTMVANPDAVQTSPALDESSLCKTDAFGNSMIHLAAQNGDIDAIAAILLTAPEQVHARNKQDMTPAMVATQFGQLEALVLLHAKGADLNFCSPNGLFPLYVAIERNYHALARWMIENVSNLALDQTLDTRMTALHAAIQNESIALAQCLIEKGARCDIPRKSDGYTALHCAAAMGSDALLIAMRQRGLALDTPLESKKTPLHLAAQSGEYKAVEYLISQAAVFDNKTLEGETALNLAIKAGHAEVARLLAKHTPVNLLNEQQQTASLLALLYGMPGVGDLLIARGEDPNRLDKQGLNYLYYLVRNGEYQRFQRLLKTHPVNVNQTLHGNSLLALAAQHGHFLLVYALLDASAIYVSNTGLSLMHYAVLADDIGYLREYQEADTSLQNLACLAARHGSIQCLEWLMKTMPSSASKSIGILQNGIIGNHEKILTLLIKRCPDLNTELDSKGNTLLHDAVKHGSDRAAILLLTHGCQPQKRNRAGETAFHIAKNRDDFDLLNQLFKRSRPGDWPAELWQTKAEKQSAGMTRLLRKYQKRLPAQSTQPAETAQPSSSSAQIPDITELQTVLTPSPLLTPVTSEQLATLKSHLAYSDFDAATALLRESSDLIAMFQSAMGGALLQQIIANISDFETFEAQLCTSSSSSTQQTFKPIDTLLSFLRKIRINPALHTGKDNPLLAMIGAEKDAEACYQLDVFARHFPESIPVLAQDKPGSRLKLATLAIKREKTALFEKLDATCRQQHDTTYSGLHEATNADNYALTERMLAFYPVDTVNLQGQTALMLAAANGHVPIINLLLRHGASVTALDVQGQHALHYALDSDDDLAALALIPVLKNPNQPNRFGLTPLMQASEKGMMAVIRLLCDAESFLNHTDKFGKNALHYAANKGQASSLDYLISKGLACDQAEVPANPAKAHRCLQRTPLHLAALGGHVEAVLRLLELGADPLKEDSHGNTFSEYAVRSKEQRLMNLTKLLPFYHQIERDTPLLHAAAQADNTDILRELIADGVDLNALNKTGHSALHLAVINNAPAVVDVLSNRDDVALSNPDQWGNTPLHYAALKGHVRLVARLLRAGAKPDIQNHDGCTPLYLACEQGKSGAVAVLLKNKVDNSVKNGKGLSPLDIALQQGHSDIANQLKNGVEDFARICKRHGFLSGPRPSGSANDNQRVAVTPIINSP